MDLPSHFFEACLPSVACIHFAFPSALQIVSVLPRPFLFSWVYALLLRVKALKAASGLTFSIRTNTAKAGLFTVLTKHLRL